MNNYLAALDILSGAIAYIREQWDDGMNRDQAKINLETRSILWNCSNQILREHGIGITREEIEGALIIERQL